MKVARKFRWEAAHRLPFVDSPCSNLHGHSYRMLVELEGTPGAAGMLMDFQQLKSLVKPLVDAWDHATLVAQTDELLLKAVTEAGFRHVVFPFDTTCENLAGCVADYLFEHAEAELRHHGITTVRVRLSETEKTYAEIERHID